MHSLREDVAVSISIFEIHMPPTLIFFHMISQLVVHVVVCLVEELELCGYTHSVDVEHGFKKICTQHS